MDNGTVITQQPKSVDGIAQLQKTFTESEILTPLQNLGYYIIKKTGLSTRNACDSSDRILFTYSEEIVKKPYGANLFFADGDGLQFIRAEVDLRWRQSRNKGTKVLTGNGDLDLGSIRSISLLSAACEQSYSGSSNLGLGNLEFKHNSSILLCCRCCCYFYCRLCYCLDNKWEIELDGRKVGEITLAGGSSEVEFEKGLDPRLKALIVVASFSLVSLAFGCY